MSQILTLNLSRAFTEKNYIPWLYSRLRFKFLNETTLNQQIPWIPYEAKKWLDNYLDPSMTVFEYGSGGSSIYISKKVKKIISVESSPEWCAILHKEIEKLHIGNCDLSLFEPEEKVRCDASASPHFNENTIKFEKYAKSIMNFPDESFDLVFIDGKARVACAFYARAKVRPGGYILLDNSDVEKHSPAMYLESWDSRSFYSLVPTNHNPSEATIWRRPL